MMTQNPRVPPAYRLVALAPDAELNSNPRQMAAEGAEDGTLLWRPRDDVRRARKAARRVAFRGHRRASAALDDVETSPARRLLPGGREKTIICRTLL